MTPGAVVRLGQQLERAHVGAATRRRALAVLQSMMRFAIVEGHIDHNPVAAVHKPAYQRERTPTLFTPLDVEQIRAGLRTDVGRMLVSVLAYAGPRPEEALRLTWGDVGDRTLRIIDTKRKRTRHTPLLAPLAQDLREWRLQQGRPLALTPVIPTRDGEHWSVTDWANWRNRIWTARDQLAGAQEATG